MSREFMVSAAMIIAIVAAVLTIVDRSLSLRKRFKIFRRRYAPRKKEWTPPAWVAALPGWLKNLGPPTSYLFLYEVIIITAAGVVLNYLGLVLSVHLQSVLYLDMMGTAFAAFLLGPWWGAIVALLTNSVVNWLLYPGPDAELIIFPWSIVNMTGGYFWGLMARRANFVKYLRETSSSAIPHLWYLFTFGVMGACVMSVPGTFVQAALADQTKLVLNPDVVSTFERLAEGWQATVRGQLEALFGVAWADSLGWATVNWLHNWLRYIPDKTMSVAIALIILKYGFPLFERELIHGGASGNRPSDNRITPLLLGLLYAPSFVTLLFAEIYMGHLYWPLWSAPWLFILSGYSSLRHAGPPEAVVREARHARARRYASALKPIERDPHERFCQRLVLATLIASVVFVLCFPILIENYYGVAFNFFCVVYGFLLAVHLVRMAIAQNLSMARPESTPPVELADENDVQAEAVEVESTVPR